MRPDTLSAIGSDTAAPGAVTRVLERVRAGEAEARDALFDLVHGELRRLAGAQMRGERVDHTLQPTALVSEAFLALFGAPHASFDDRAHFFATAARAMRSILVDMARRKHSEKRGGGRARLPLTGADRATRDRVHEVLDVNEALAGLTRAAPQQALVVELRFFCGLSVPETAALMGVTERTVYRLWNLARVWLFRAISA